LAFALAFALAEPDAAFPLGLILADADPEAEVGRGAGTLVLSLGGLVLPFFGEEPHLALALALAFALDFALALALALDFAFALDLAFAFALAFLGDAY